MSTDPRLIDYLKHVLNAIKRIDRYTADLTETAFLGRDNELIQDAVIRNFEIIGEASHNIEKRFPDFVTAHPDLPLLDAYDMRNALAHGYFRVDLEMVWSTARNDLPQLHRYISCVLEDLK
jgi:uncharacterized protein with HEPN domain